MVKWSKEGTSYILLVVVDARDAFLYQCPYRKKKKNSDSSSVWATCHSLGWAKLVQMFIALTGV